MLLDPVQQGAPDFGSRAEILKHRERRNGLW
jgi:hypothetical protein